MGTFYVISGGVVDSQWPSRPEAFRRAAAMRESGRSAVVAQVVGRYTADRDAKED